MKWRYLIIGLVVLVAWLYARNPELLDELKRVVGAEERVEIPEPFPVAGTSGVNQDTAPTIRTVPKSQITQGDLKVLALALINEDRRVHGLGPVTLGTNGAAQSHADDMLAGTYLGHWWRDGKKPYLVYSETGGASYVAENAARAGFNENEYAANCTGRLVRCEKVDPAANIRELHHDMVYDDADSDWGHRDNILGPTHRKVNIGIAYSDRFLAFVQHFEGGAVAVGDHFIENGVLALQARIAEPDTKIFDALTIHYEPPPVPRSVDAIEKLHRYCVGGGFTEGCGDPLFRIVPPPPPGMRYGALDSAMVVADVWRVDTDTLEIVAAIGDRASRDGVYTITLFEDTGSSSSGDVLLQLSVVVAGGD